MATVVDDIINIIASNADALTMPDVIGRLEESLREGAAPDGVREYVEKFARVLSDTCWFKYGMQVPSENSKWLAEFFVVHGHTSIDIDKYLGKNSADPEFRRWLKARGGRYIRLREQLLCVMEKKEKAEKIYFEKTRVAMSSGILNGGVCVECNVAHAAMKRYAKEELSLIKKMLEQKEWDWKFVALHLSRGITGDTRGDLVHKLDSLRFHIDLKGNLDHLRSGFMLATIP
jgi:hypothetical protein